MRELINLNFAGQKGPGWIVLLLLLSSRMSFSFLKIDSGVVYSSRTEKSSWPSTGLNITIVPIL